MKQKFIFFFSVLIGWCAHPVAAQSPQVRFLIDSCISMMQDKAVNADQVNWVELKKNALEKAKGLESPYGLGPAMRYLYQSLNDFHGAFFYRDSVFRWSRPEPVLSDSILNQFKKRVDIKTKMLEDQIGYLRIPSMPGEEFSAHGQRLNDSLCSLLVNHLKGIILDLRLNGGGAMFPMILGVEQLQEDGIVGSFHSKKKSVDWLVRDHHFVLDTSVLATIRPVCSMDARQIPVVMLVSPATGSSAEFFIIAFKGRKNTVLLGSETAGYITSVAGFPINDTAFVNLSVGYGADRNGKIYKEAIKPDIPFESPDRFNDIEQDEKVKAAVKWLNASSQIHYTLKPSVYVTKRGLAGVSRS